MPPITNDFSSQFLNLLAGRDSARDMDKPMEILTEKMDSVLDALRENSAVKVDKNGKQRITGLAGDGYNIDVVGATEKSQKMKMQPLQKKVERKKKEIEALKEFKQKIKDLQNFMDGSVSGGDINSVFAKKKALVNDDKIAVASVQSGAKIGLHTIDVKQLASEGSILSRKFAIETLNTSNFIGNIIIKKDGELLHCLETERDTKTGMVISEKIKDNSNINLLQDNIDNFFSKLDELEFFTVSKVKNDLDNTYVYSVKYSGQGNITFEDDQGGNIVNAIFDNTVKETVKSENYTNLVFDTPYKQTDIVIQEKDGFIIEIFDDKECKNIKDSISFALCSKKDNGIDITYSKLIEILTEKGYECTQIKDVNRNDDATYLKIQKESKDVFINIKSGYLEGTTRYSSRILLPNGNFDSNDPVKFGKVKLISEGFDFTIELNEKYSSINDLCNKLNSKIHAQNNDVEAFIEKLNGNDWQQTIGFRYKFENNGHVGIGVEYEAVDGDDSFKAKASDFYLDNSVFDKSYALDEKLPLNAFDFKFKIFSDPECKFQYSPIEVTKADFNGSGEITLQKFINKLKSKYPVLRVNEITDPENSNKKYINIIKGDDNAPLFIGGNFTFGGSHKNVWELDINNAGPFGSGFNINTDKVFCNHFSITSSIGGKSENIEFLEEKGKTLSEWCKYFNEELPKDTSFNLPVKIKAKIENNKLVLYSSETFSVSCSSNSTNGFKFVGGNAIDNFVPFVNSINISTCINKSFEKSINKFHVDDIDDLYRGVVSKSFDEMDRALNISGSIDISVNGGDRKTLQILTSDTLDSIADKVRKLNVNLDVMVRKTEVPVYPTPPDTEVKFANKYVLQISCNKEDNVSFYAVSSDTGGSDYKDSADLMVFLGLIDGSDQADTTKYPQCVLSDTSDGKNNAFKIKNSNTISRAVAEVAKPLICVIDNVLIENTSNTLNNNLQGISIECAEVGKTSINVVPDIKAIFENISGFVQKYNDFIIFANRQLEKKKDVDDKGNPIITPAEHAYLYNNDIFKDAVKKLKTSVIAYQGSKKLQNRDLTDSERQIMFLSEVGITMKLKEHFDDEDTYDIGVLEIDEEKLTGILERKSEAFIDFMKIFLDFKGVDLEEAKGQFLTEFDTTELNIFLTKKDGKKVFKKFMKKYDFGNIAIMSDPISKTDKFNCGEFLIKREAIEYDVSSHSYKKIVRNFTINGNKTPEEFIDTFNNFAFSDDETSKNNGSYAMLEPDPYDDSKTRIVIYGGGHSATYNENGADVERKTVKDIKYYIESTNEDAVKKIFNNVNKSGDTYDFNNVFKCDSDCNVISGGANVRISKYSDQKDLLGTKIVGAVFSVNDFSQFVSGKRIQFKHNFTGTMLNVLNEIYTSGIIKIATDTADKELKSIQSSIGRKEENNAKELEIVKKKQADMDSIRAKANEAHTRLKAIIKSLHSDS